MTRLLRAKLSDDGEQGVHFDRLEQRRDGAESGGAREGVDGAGHDGDGHIRDDRIAKLRASPILATW